MLSAFIISQILIGIAFLFDLASFQFKERKVTVACFAFAASLISAHFFLLGATTASVLVAISAIRFLASIFTTDPRLKYFFLVLILSVGALTYDGYEDIFITVAMLISTVAVFNNDEKRLRQMMMVSISIVITHNIIVFTPAGIALEVFFLGSNLLSYWRFYLRKNQGSITL